MLTYQEWQRSKEGQETISGILLHNSELYPDTFAIGKILRVAYADYKRKGNE